MRIEILAVACVGLALPVAAWSQEAAPIQTGSRVRVTRMTTLLAADQPLGAQPGTAAAPPRLLVISTGVLLECDASRLRMVSDGSPAESRGDTLELVRSQIARLEIGHASGNGGVGALLGIVAGAIIGVAVAGAVDDSTDEWSSITTAIGAGVGAGVGAVAGAIVGHLAVKTNRWQEVPAGAGP